MKKEEIQALFSQFEQVSCVTNGIECWSARDLCSLLGYKLWQNFTKVIDKAKEACVNVGQNVEDHGTADIFRGIMVSLYVKGKENGHVQAYAPTGAMVLK